MNNGSSYSFSFSYHLDTYSDTPPAAADLIAFDSCHEYPLTNHQILLRSDSSSQQTIVTQDVLVSLHQCHRFRTLDEHQAHLQSSIPELSGQAEDIKAVISSVRDAGLMISAADKLRALQSAPESQTRIPQACFCILSCDRPLAVERLLESLLQNHPTDTNNRYYLVDDSRTRENQQANRELCKRFAQEGAFTLHYFGSDEQNSYLEKLIHALPEHAEGIRFLLDRQVDRSIPSYGRTRNWASLLGAGGLLVLLDDDILFQRVIAPHANNQLIFSSASREVDIFSSNEEWLPLQDKDHPDPTSGVFLKALGRTFPDLANMLSQPSPAPEIFRDLAVTDYHRIHAHSRVMVTTCGSIGDPGTTSNEWIYQLKPDTRNWLLGSEENYRKCLSSRTAWLGRNDYTLLNSFSLMSAVTGIDATNTLPPFFPVQRNEDFLFGTLLQHIYPQALFLDQPWAVPHLPIEKRTGYKTHSPTYGLLDFSADALTFGHQRPLSDDHVHRMSFIADFYSILAEADDKSILQLLAEQTLALRSAHLRRMNRILEQNPGAPDYWLRDLESIIQTTQKSLISPLPEGFAGMPGTEAEQRQSAKQLWSRFAAGIQAWAACQQWMRENHTTSS